METVERSKHRAGCREDAIITGLPGLRPRANEIIEDNQLAQQAGNFSASTLLSAMDAC